MLQLPSPPCKDLVQASEATFTIILNYHALTKPKLGLCAQPKDKINIKVEIKKALSVNSNSYTFFLILILQKHNVLKYTVTDHKCYSFDYSFIITKCILSGMLDHNLQHTKGGWCGTGL